MVSEKVWYKIMNSSSKTLILIVAGATAVAATLGVTFGTIASRVSTQDAAGTPQPTLTLSQTRQPVVSAIAADRPETPSDHDCHH